MIESSEVQRQIGIQLRAVQRQHSIARATLSRIESEAIEEPAEPSSYKPEYREGRLKSERFRRAVVTRRPRKPKPKDKG